MRTSGGLEQEFGPGIFKHAGHLLPRNGFLERKLSCDDIEYTLFG
jgi:hypothetical protein